MSKDFIVSVNDRYNMTRDEFTTIMGNHPETVYIYEEESSSHTLPNVDYNNLFVGARLYADSAPESCCHCTFDEIEITHIYGGVVFFKYLEGLQTGVERFAVKNSLNFNRRMYPKIVLIPPTIKMRCDCDKVQFKSWDE